MPYRPSFMDRDALQRSDIAALKQQTDADLFKLTFQNQTNDDLTRLALQLNSESSLANRKPMTDALTPAPARQPDPIQTTTPADIAPMQFKSTQQATPTEPMRFQSTQDDPTVSVEEQYGQPRPQTWTPVQTGGASAPPTAASGVPSAMPTGAPPQSGDLAAYTRAKALSLGIDPDVAVRVAESEGGFGDPVRQSDVVYQGQREQSYGPFQLNVNGGLGSAALQQGIDPRNPAHVYRAIDFALEDAARNGWGAFHGAARVGVGP